MDIVAKAVELFEDGDYEAAFQLSAQFDKYQQDSFFKSTGQLTEDERLSGRILVGAYKIEKEKDPQKKRKAMEVYDALCDELSKKRG